MRLKTVSTYAGPFAAGVASIWALARLLRDAPEGHWTTFTGASARLWAGLPVYGIAIGDNSWFYSPSAGLFVFRPFYVAGLMFGTKAGLIAYTLFSLAIFAWGVHELSRRTISDERLRSGVWLLIAPSLYSSLQAHKLETLITGILLLATAEWAGDPPRKRAIFFTVLAGMSAEWKLQTLPSLALALVARWRLERALLVIAGIVTSLALPFLRLPWGLSWSNLESWVGSLSAFSGTAFSTFDNIYAFMKNVFGLSMSFRSAQAVALVAAAALAAVTQVRLRKLPDPRAVLIAAGLGACFTTLFSPLQQINAYIMLVPAWIAALASLQWQGSRSTSVSLVLIWLVLTFGYSDLIPEAVRPAIRHAVVRAPCVLALAIWLLWAQKKIRMPARR